MIYENDGKNQIQELPPYFPPDPLQADGNTALPPDEYNYIPPDPPTYAETVGEQQYATQAQYDAQAQYNAQAQYDAMAAAQYPTK